MEEPTMNNMEQRLWDYIDGITTPSERTAIDDLIATNNEWKNKYRELLEVSALLKSSEMDAPSLRFTKNVMEEIGKLHIAPAASTYINKKIIWGISIFFFVMIIGFLVYGFGQVQISQDANSTISENVNKINFSRFFSNTYMNVLMMVNVVVGLFLLDNYLGRKRKAFRNEF